MLAVRLPDSLEEQLNELAEKTGRTKTHYVRKAIERFLDDEADRLLAISRLENESSSISLEDMEKKLGLED